MKRRKIAFLAPYSIIPEDHHSAVRCWDVIRNLERNNFEIHLLVPSIYKTDVNDYKLKAREIGAIKIYTSRILKERGRNPGLLLKIFLYPFGNFFLNLNPKHIINTIKLLLKENILYTFNSYIWGIPTLFIFKILFNSKLTNIVDACNIETLYFKDLYRKVRFQRLVNIIGSIFYSYEKFCWNFADWLVLISSKEKQIIEEIIQKSKIKLIPPSVDISHFKNVKVDRDEIRIFLDIPKDSKILVFHGTNIGHNNEARKVIEEEISRRFQENEKVFFLIFGPGHYTENKVSKRGNVRIVGTVPYEMLIKLLKASDIAIVPLLSGAGFKGKLLDYIAAEVPIVATAKAIDGTGLHDKKHLLVSKRITPDFIDNINKLLENRPLVDHLIKNSKIYLEDMGKDKFSSNLDDLLDELE
ncbi:MAG: glycosyltransferase [Promethearchaeota archaeon]